MMVTDPATRPNAGDLSDLMGFFGDFGSVMGVFA
jgi:hypothetical protein